MKEDMMLCNKLKELRKKNNCSMDELIKILNTINENVGNKSTLSRVESGKINKNTLIEYTMKYCKAFGLTDLQTQQFLRGDKIVVPDTSALLKNTQLIDELNEEYSKVIIPNIVIEELEGIKNIRGNALSKKAWEILRGISYGDRTISVNYKGNDKLKNDRKIIVVAEEASKKYNSIVDIITDDIDYSAYLKGNETVTSLHLRDYMVTKQAITNIREINEINNCYKTDYTNIKKLTKEESNIYLQDGNTLIISTIRNKKKSFEMRKEKIKWLISCGADVNQRDCKRRYFPPLSHAIQIRDFDMFKFLLNECNANPNIGSRNPYDSGKVRQKNEGNMPLMIACWDNKPEFVKELCKNKQTSINQQDANGYTALIKTSLNGSIKCRDILLKYNADEKIVDIDGKTYKDRYEDYLEFGDKRAFYGNKNKNKNKNK